MKSLLGLVLGLALALGAHAEEESAGRKIVRGIEKGGQAAAHGIEKGADATSRGVNKATEATGRAFNRADEWVSSKLKLGTRGGKPAPADPLRSSP